MGGKEELGGRGGGGSGHEFVFLFDRKMARFDACASAHNWVGCGEERSASRSLKKWAFLLP